MSINKKDNILKKTWNFLWNEDSFVSWLVFMLIVFVLIKFIFFPLLSFTTGTSLPIVIVESCSMYHGTSFDDWWDTQGKWYEDRGITKEEFQKFPLKNGFSKGDIFFILGTKKEKLDIGDTIIFLSGTSNRPIIHRVVNLDPIGTKGDHNPVQFSPLNNAEKLDEINIKESTIIGKTTFVRIPYLGWIKLIFYEPFRDPVERGLCKSL